MNNRNIMNKSSKNSKNSKNSKKSKPLICPVCKSPFVNKIDSYPDNYNYRYFERVSYVCESCKCQFTKDKPISHKSFLYLTLTEEDPNAISCY